MILRLKKKIRQVLLVYYELNVICIRIRYPIMTPPLISDLKKKSLTLTIKCASSSQENLTKMYGCNTVNTKLS